MQSINCQQVKRFLLKNQIGLERSLFCPPQQLKGWLQKSSLFQTPKTSCPKYLEYTFATIAKKDGSVSGQNSKTHTHTKCPHQKVQLPQVTSPRLSLTAIRLQKVKSGSSRSGGGWWVGVADRTAVFVRQATTCSAVQSPGSCDI